MALAGFWMWPRQLRRSGVADAIWPLVTAALAVFYANAGAGDGARRSAVAWMIGSWGARLAVHLLWVDVFGGEPDERRESLWHFERQALRAAFFSLPALFPSINAAPMLSPLELTAAGIWLIGFSGETTADRQLVRWRRETAAAAEESDRDAACRAGLWRYVRRAHDVFELVTWTGHALFASASPLGWLAVACPLAVAFRFSTGGTARAQL